MKFSIFGKLRKIYSPLQVSVEKAFYRKRHSTQKPTNRRSTLGKLVLNLQLDDVRRKCDKREDLQGGNVNFITRSCMQFLSAGGTRTSPFLKTTQLSDRTEREVFRTPV